MSTDLVLLLLPELLLVLVAMGIYLGATWKRSETLWSAISAGAIALALLLLLAGKSSAMIDQPLHGPISTDFLGFCARGLALVFGLLLVLINMRPAYPDLGPEFLGSLLLLVSGMMFVSAAQELVVLFMGLELITIPTYILLYMSRKAAPSDVSGQEAATKYFFLSVLSTAILLYGLSFLYGAAGSTDLTVIREKLATANDSPWGQLALLLILAGLGFKITAVPFHFYAPDVYQGAGNAATALLAVVPKFAGFIVLARVLLVLGGSQASGWWLVWLLAAVTMTWGNVMALMQNNLRRMLAFSSIAHSGYMLIGVSMAFALPLGAEGGFQPLPAVLFYLSLYGFTTIGILAALTYLGTAERQVDSLDELAGLGRAQPLVGLTLAALLLSLAGIPPLAGFWGKLLLFGSAVTAYGDASLGLGYWPLALAIIGALNAAIAAGYYLRLIGIMYFRDAGKPLAVGGGIGPFATSVTCAALVVLLGLFPDPLSQAAFRAGRSAERAMAARIPSPKSVKVAAPSPSSTAPTVAVTTK